MFRVTPGGSPMMPVAPAVEMKAEFDAQLMLRRVRLWNRLAERPMVLIRNVFWKVQPVTQNSVVMQSRSRSIWGLLRRGW